MANIVRAATSQTTRIGDRASMLDKHATLRRDPAAEGALVSCSQELFRGPCFGITLNKRYSVAMPLGRRA